MNKYPRYFIPVTNLGLGYGCTKLFIVRDFNRTIRYYKNGTMSSRSVMIEENLEKGMKNGDFEEISESQAVLIL